MKLRWSGIVAFGLSLGACAGSSTRTARLEIVVVGNGVTSPPAGAHDYPSGARVTVTATPTGGASFTGWSGLATALDSSVEVAVGGDSRLVAHFSGGGPAGGSSGASGGGASSSSGGSSGGGSSSSGGSSGSDGSSSSGAASSGGSSSGAASSGGPSSSGASSSGSSGGSSTSSGGATQFTLMVNVAGAGGGVVSGMGVECGTSCSATYPALASVTLGASPGSGSTFSSWSGACTGGARTCTVSMTADQTVTATFAVARSFTNPVFWEDLPDPDVLRVDDTYYALGSSFHYSPGAPILRSYDLVSWEPAGHAVPVLDVSPSYDLNGGRAYVKGIGASFLGYRRSNKTFYWGGCIGLTTKTSIYTATSVEGPWQKSGVVDACYVDPSLLVDDDDKLYVAHGNTTLSVAELTADGLGQVRTQQVFTAPFAAQGSRFYKVNGSYYILVSRPGSGEYVLRSTTGPFGPYTMQPLVDGVGAPVSGGGAPFQGGIVQTQGGDWYYLASMAAYPGGRFPILAPVTWGADGWPAVQLVNGAWGASYTVPAVPAAPRATRPLTGVDRFAGPALGPDWEWNHNPDGTRWSLENGLRLQAATVTTDLYSARNTLTHRILGPTSTATILLDHSGMRDGDRAGLALLRDTSAWVGVLRDGGATRVAMMHGLLMDAQWNTTGTGGEVSNAPVSGGTIWLRASTDITPGARKQARFSYSTDGVTFTPIGTSFAIEGTGDFLLGYRFGLFNYATQTLGGVVTVRSFELAVP